MADGSITFSTALDNRQLEKELAALNKRIAKKEQEIASMRFKRDETKLESENLNSILQKEKERLDVLKAQRVEMRQVLADQSISKGTKQETRLNMPVINQQIADQQARVQQLQKQWDQAEGSVKRYNQRISESEAELDRQKEEAGELTERINEEERAQSKMSGAIKQAGEQMGKFLTRVRRLASRVFVFTLITTALRSMRTWLWNSIKANDKATEAISRLKGALLTMAQPLLKVIIPVFITLVNILTKVVSVIASVVSMIFGTTAEESAAAAESLYNQQKGLQGVGSAAKKAGKQLASFDEINKISSEDSSGGAGGAEAGAIEPNFDSSFIKGELDKITVLVGGALLAIGAILTFSGFNIPLGITLMAAGALTLATAAAANWGAISEMLQGPIGAVMAVVSAAALVIGVLLAFTGINIMLGITLIAIGAAGMASAIAANWDTLPTEIQNVISVLGAILGTAALIFGVILAFTGANLPLGIALMIVGATALASAVAVNWEFIQTALQGPIGTITAMVSVALLVLGAVLLFSGAATALGIGLLAVGAIGLATSIAANWETIQQTLGSTFDAIVAIVSAGLLVIGVILLFTGAASALGLGMIIAGTTGLAVSVVPNWDFIKNAIKGAWENMKQWWDSTASEFFTLEYWAGLAEDMLDGLFGGLSELGSKIEDWGSDFIDGVKDFFGIASPSKEFKSLGGYMMAGLNNGVGDDTDMVISTFAVMFDTIAGLCNKNVETMIIIHTEFLTFLLQKFEPEWKKSWTRNYQNAHSSIRLVMSDIDALNRKLAAIERNITITITTIRREISESSGSSSGSKSAASSSRIAAMPAIQMADIPALAQGAVIPPNREFAAILGDQNRGYNVEAPAELIKQMVIEGIRAVGGMNGSRDIHITLEMDRQVFGRAVYKANNDETQRVGVSFAGVRSAWCKILCKRISTKSRMAQ